MLAMLFSIGWTHVDAPARAMLVRLFFLALFTPAVLLPMPRWRKG